MPRYVYLNSHSGCASLSPYRTLWESYGLRRGSARSYPFAVEARANGQEILGSDFKKVVLT